MLDEVPIEDFTGHVRNKNLWEKKEIKVILGSENLLCPNDLLKIGRLGVVNRKKEIERIVKESTVSKKGELETILKKYSNCYSRSKNDCGKVQSKYEHKIQGGIPPPQRQYKINSKAEKEISETIQELTEQGIIRKLGRNEAAVTNAPIQAVAKPQGGWRLVTNYKALNKVTVPDTRYLINCGEASAEIGKEKNWLSKIDLANGFWSIPLAEESQGKTAFTYQGDQYVYTRLPQGYKNSPNVFQSMMVETLSGLPVTVYIDDILIATETEAEHLNLLEETLDRITKAGLKPSLKKMEIGKQEVD
ncbi:MAG: reverse transcriptase domain-containing protein, partial [Cetobacterium sp.]